MDDGSPSEKKIAFYHAQFAAPTDVYAVRWENNRTGRSEWMPAVRGDWRKGADRDLAPTDEVIRRHLTGALEIGPYPHLDGDRWRWLAADFDGYTAMLDALAYVKAARAVSASVAGGFPVWCRRPCLACLHRTNSGGGHRPADRRRTASRGNLETRAHEFCQL